ncbi:hypothetical protein K9U39_08040 [Rhodoblastus acidophilus]|uniref:Autotransporter domain-containing protein n=1 Tax=Candidatus Rhodoblastus alkanivorans TaxID=2954117 RepID=A0ABS9Z7E6_9HYPH|nr:hypothetical protein [Candidatus Rhodoblastus alkanivorans]MCI4678321.1 hypothetical protein [Candidatus Rhodoblastus alkanivorans]MCI4683579.1 hypothetical protein [Candidatus Rhodoblastus alkanivorans]MDI4640895.1 hypothetical protein [Rhodoblastus acidophilus]
MTTYYFTGRLDNDWTSVEYATINGTNTTFAANWGLSTSYSQQVYLPGPGDNVILATGTAYAQVVIGASTYQGYSSPLDINSLTIDSGMVLDQNAGPFTIYSALTNNGTFNLNVGPLIFGQAVVSNGQITGGAIQNNGYITVAGGAYLDLKGTVTLQGSGVITMVGGDIYHQAYLTGADPNGVADLINYSTIQGAGLITAHPEYQYDPAAPLVIENHGWIEATDSANALGIHLNNGPGGGLTNSGFVEATLGATLNIWATRIDQTSSGVIAAYGAGSTVIINDAYLAGGMIDGSGGGTVNFAPTGYGGFDTLDGSGADGAVTIGAGGKLVIRERTTVLGTITNHGEIDINYQLMVGTGDVTLNGGGKVILSGTGLQQLTGASSTTATTLHNVDNTISGAGIIGAGTSSGQLGNLLVLDNQASGVIDANTSGANIFMDNAVSNAGVLEATSGGALIIQSTKITQTSSGQIAAYGVGSQVYLQYGVTVVGGTIGGGSGGEVISTYGPNTIDGSSAAGAVTIGSGGKLVIGDTTTALGTIVNHGEIDLNGTYNALIIGDGGVTLTGGGKVVLTTTYADLIAGSNPTTATTLHNVDNTISGDGMVGGYNGLLAFDNQAAGVIDATTAGTALSILTGSDLVNNGTLEADGGLLKIYDAVTGSGQALIKNGGEIDTEYTFDQNVTFAGSGLLRLYQSYSGVVNGFAAGDSINVASASGSNPADYELVWRPQAGGGLLKIVDTAYSSVVATLKFSGSFAGEAFQMAINNDGTFQISLASAPYADPAPGDVMVTDVQGQNYTAYQQNYRGGVYQGTQYDFAASGQAYSDYAYDYSAGGAFIGSKFFYAGAANAPYSGYEYDYDGADRLTRVAFTGAAGSTYSAYEYDYVGGVFAGSKFDVAAPSGAAYSSYELDYNSSGAFVGDKFFFKNIVGQSYTGEEEDFDASGALSRVVLTGVANQAYQSLELDYAGGTFEGYKMFLSGIKNQSYTAEEVDVSAAGKLQKVVYSGLSSTPYSSVEQDYSGSTVTDTIYNFTNVSGQSYDAYHVMDNVSGVALQETFDLNSGGHALVALTGGQTLTSLGGDKMTGSGATTFVFNAIYGADTITNFSAGDTISLPTSEFADFNTMMQHTTNMGANVLISAADGDTLTLKNMDVTTLAGMAANFTFHA